MISVPNTADITVYSAWKRQVWGLALAKCASWHVFQATPEKGVLTVFQVLVSKCNPLVICAASTHDVLEMKPTAVVVLLVKGLRHLRGSGSREVNPKPDLYTV